MSGSIYTITNSVNGKIYVGSTIQGVSRWNAHKRYLNSGKHNNPLLQRSWNKYGETSFIFEFIETNIKVENLIEREQYWIDFYNSFKPNGFNIKPANSTSLHNLTDEQKQAKYEKLSQSNKGKKQSPETLAKLSAIRKGRIHSEETKQKMKEAQKKRRFQEQLNGGVSEETRKKLSESNKGKKPHTNTIEASINSRKGKPLKDEAKRKQSETGKKTWAKRKLLESMLPESEQILLKQQRSERAKKGYANRLKTVCTNTDQAVKS